MRSGGERLQNRLRNCCSGVGVTGVSSRIWAATVLMLVPEGAGWSEGQARAQRVQRDNQVPHLRDAVRPVPVQFTTQVLKGVHGGHGRPQAGDEELLLDQAQEQGIDFLRSGLHEAVL